MKKVHRSTPSFSHGHHLHRHQQNSSSSTSSHAAEPTFSHSYDQLHPRNPYYRNPPNFFDLARLYPDSISKFVAIKDYFQKKAYLDFKNPLALKALTQTLLLHDFHLNVELPDNHLCPPLPNRINYLCWLSELIENVSSICVYSDASLGHER